MNRYGYRISTPHLEDFTVLAKQCNVIKTCKDKNEIGKNELEHWQEENSPVLVCQKSITAQSEKPGHLI